MMSPENVSPLDAYCSWTRSCPLGGRGFASYCGISNLDMLPRTFDSRSFCDVIGKSDSGSCGRTSKNSEVPSTRPGTGGSVCVRSCGEATTRTALSNCLIIPPLEPVANGSRSDAVISILAWLHVDPVNAALANDATAKAPIPSTPAANLILAFRKLHFQMIAEILSLK